MNNEFSEAENELIERETQKFLEFRAITKRLDAIEEIIIAHQGWTVLQHGERQCHLNVRHLLLSIKSIMNNGS